MLNVPDTASLGTSSATGNPRNKVALKKGRGLMDWVRLGHSEPDLSQTGGKLLKITREELAKHNKRDDAWIALRGNVYNVTPYFEYHPGGEDELMKGVGIDATDLFNEVHKWVNFATMLQKCLVGTLVECKSLFSKPEFLPLKKLGISREPKKKNAADSTNRLFFPSIGSLKPKSSDHPSPAPLLPTYVHLPPPKYDWFQTKTLINVAIYTKWKDVRKYHVIIINHEQYFKALVYIQDQVYTLNLEFFKPIERKFELKIGNGSGKVDILMKKSLPGVRWSSLGKTLRGNGQLVSLKDKKIEYLSLRVSKRVKLTHNTILMTLAIPENIYFGIPIGYHVYLRHPNSDVVKPYTPVVTPFRIEPNDEENPPHDIQIFFKVYSKGSITPLLDTLKEEDSIDVSFPEGCFTMAHLYQAASNASRLILLGAGTGITPLIRLMLEALKNEMHTLLVTFNRTEDDIPWRMELDALVAQSKQFRVSHVLSQPSESWKGYSGHVSEDLLIELIPEPEEEDAIYICVCGSTGFTTLALRLLEELGYAKETIFAFIG